MSRAPATNGDAHANRPNRRPTLRTRTVLDPLSSVKVGITLLVVLFLYSSIGSAGIWYPVAPNLLLAASWRHEMVRQWPVFEMTEFEWFHTPFFVGLCALICANIAVTTIRRIPLKIVNLGVWMIHAGVITLAFGSVVYFGTKIEGDSPVFRRLVQITARDGARLAIPALPGARGGLSSTSGTYQFSVAQINPEWPLLSGEHEGERAYSVTLSVEGPTGRFMSQVIDGFPQYTEDVIPGRGRALKLEEFGTRTIDPSFDVALEYFPQPRFWVRDTAALAARRITPGGGHGPWVEAPIEGLPRYNDYVATRADLWSDSTLPTERLLRISPSTGPDHPLSTASPRITGYLRYAVLHEGIVPTSGGPLDPVVTVSISTPMAGVVRQDLAAFDPSRRRAFDGFVAFEYVGNAEALDRLVATARTTLTVEASRTADEPAERLDIALDANDVDWGTPIAIGDSGWSVQIRDVARDLAAGNGQQFSLAILEVQSPEGDRFVRWAFEDPALSRDLPPETAHTDTMPNEPDPRLRTAFQPGLAAPIVVVAGPGQSLHALLRETDGSYTLSHATIGRPIGLGSGSVTVEAFHESAARIVKPFIVPLNRRNRDADLSRTYSMVRVELETDAGLQQVWLPFHRYSFDDATLAAPGLGRFEPTPVRLADGSLVELIFTRESRPLPSPVAMDDFVLTTHVGGYTGDVSSVRDWTSVLRFWDGARWGPETSVASNKPTKHRGLQYFQAFWNNPASDGRGGAGMNFTGLGVGNRHAVGVMLAGASLSAIGMMYAFYVKPIIKRRRRLAVEAELASMGLGAREPEWFESSHDREGAAEGLTARRAAFEEEHT